MLLDPLLKYSGLYEIGGVRGDLAASLQVWAGGRPLALPVHTAYKHFTSRWKYVAYYVLLVILCEIIIIYSLMNFYDAVGTNGYIYPFPTPIYLVMRCCA